MKLTTKYLIAIIVIVPIAAYLDSILIRGMSFEEYLYVCFWEMVLFTLGIYTGIRLLRKELEK